MRQKIRNAIVFISLLVFPLTLNYFSPYLSVSGAAQGVISGSLAFFGLLFLFALFLGRAFCGWLCPVGCFQDICQKINNRRLPRAHGVKYLIWVPWFGIILYLIFQSGGVQKIDLFFMMESFVSVDEPLRYITYYFVLLLFFILAVSIGRHAFCHYSCWLAPFMIFGRNVRNLFRWPSLQLKAASDRCINCLTCTSNCPMSLEVHKHVKKKDMENSDSILCGQCADNCQQNVISYSFGRRKK